MKQNDKMAFPALPQGEGFCGMTLREWYAGMALQGLLAANEWPSGRPAKTDEQIKAGWAAEAFVYADAMLAEAAGNPGEPAADKVMTHLVREKELYRSALARVAEYEGDVCGVRQIGRAALNSELA